MVRAPQLARVTVTPGRVPPGLVTMLALERVMVAALRVMLAAQAMALEPAKGKARGRARARRKRTAARPHGIPSASPRKPGKLGRPPARPRRPTGWRQPRKPF